MGGRGGRRWRRRHRGEEAKGTREKRRDGERTGRNGRGGGAREGVRARRERGGVGKGARGVVQFRVGITLDFRGDVATSPALSPSTPPPTSAASSAFSGLHNPTTPSPRFSSLRFLRILCFAISARRPPTPRTTGKEHPPRHYLGEIDPSARATLYTVHQREHIASDDIPLLSLSPSTLSPDVAAGRPTDRPTNRRLARSSADLAQISKARALYHAEHCLLLSSVTRRRAHLPERRKIELSERT